uniref:F-box associated domain-containing protein n=1 Tax=Oryza punctata TaxID=4537 RepID=A0A0E0L5W6_ORYPU
MAAISAETIPIELWQEILLRASTKDVARGAASLGTPPPGSSTMTGTPRRLLCFASHSTAKVIVHNPVTSEKLEIPKAPPLRPDQHNLHSPSMFALGFSLTTGVYKLFRFADRTMDVYTLGAAAAGEASGWRQHTLRRPCSLVENTPPVVVVGKICMVTVGPAPFGQCQLKKMTTTYRGSFSTSSKLTWMGFDSTTMVDFKGNPWVLGSTARPNTLCYRVGNNVYCKYVGTTTATTLSTVLCFSSTKVMSWDCKICLPVSPSSFPACQWDIYAGCRPTLLSPLTFASGQHEEEDNKSDLFIRSLLRALRSQKSQKCRPSPTLAGCNNAKRICCRNP